MINFDSLSLKALIREIEPILTEGRVQKVQQPSRTELLLSIRSGGKNHKLFLCVDPKYPHVCFLSEQGEEYRHIQIPKKPPMFCMLLRKHMEGAKIKAVRQPANERILEIHFDSYNEIGDRASFVLACELMGKYSNIILYNYENCLIYGSAHSVSSEKSREREISGGMPYVYPPKQNKKDLLELSEQDFYNLASSIPSTMDVWLNQTFYNISMALAQELCSFLQINIEKDKVISTKKEKIYDLYTLTAKTLKVKNIKPSISKDKKKFSPIGIDPKIEWEEITSVNEMIDLYFGYQYYKDKFKRLRSSLLSSLKKELKKQKNKYSHHIHTQDKEDKAEKYRQYADILMANLNNIQPSVQFVELENFYNENHPVKISLDTSLSPSENAQKYYKLYNKAKNAAKFSESVMDEIKGNISYLESIEVSLNQAETMASLEEIQEELTVQEMIKSKTLEKPKKDKALNIDEYNSSDNYKIFIGKNNKQNDYIISKLSSSNDIWLHAQNIPGSHVLIKVPPEIEEVPEKTIEEAAELAAYFSQGRESSQVPIIYTRRKFIKKPPAAKPGFVIFTHEKTVFVTPNSLNKQ